MYMNDFTKANLKELLEREQAPCVSLFMPTYRKGDSEQNSIRLKNLIRITEEKLRLAGLRNPEQYTDQLRSISIDPLFWQELGDGLALFMTDTFFRSYRLPLTFPEFVYVNKRFYVKPVLPLLEMDGTYYILALSQNMIRFFRATRHSVEEIEARAMPSSLAEALKYDYLQQQLQFTTQTTGGASPGGKRDAMFHGQGVGTDDAKDRILRYFQEVDKGVLEMIGNETCPLVLAGVDYLLPIYRKANNYKYLVDTGVEGNQDQTKADELHRASWNVVEPLFRRGFEEALTAYAQREGTGNTSSLVEQVLIAAAGGRVETLFVALSLRQWGRFSAESLTVELLDNEEQDAEDLLNTAALLALSTGGTVYAVPPESVPGTSSIAAVFRYALPG